MAAGRSSTSNFRRLVAALLFVAALAAPLAFFGDMYEAAAAENKINLWNQQRWADFYESDPIDLLFVGSSHAYCTFDPDAFDGHSAFQLGMPLQQPDATLATLQEAFRVHQPKTVVLELYWGVMGAYNAKQADMLFQALDNPALEAAYYQAAPVAERVKRVLKPIRYQDDFWAYEDAQLADWLEAQGLPKPDYRQLGVEYYRSKGYLFCDYVISEDKRDRTNQYRNLDGRNIDWTTRAETYVAKIAALCREQGADLICVTAPIAPVSLAKIQHYDAIHRRAATLCERLDIPYVDYNLINEAERLVANENFRDDAHLNDSGVQIISKDFQRRMLGNAQPIE